MIELFRSRRSCIWSLEEHHSGRFEDFVAMDEIASLVHSDVCHHVLSLAEAISEVEKRFLMYIKLSR
jgi:hypothetical protein